MAEKKKRRKKQLNFQQLGLDEFYSLYHEEAGKKFFHEFFSFALKKPEKGLKDVHFFLDTGGKLLLGFYRKRDGSLQPAGVTLFTEQPKEIRTSQTFVAEKFRRQGVAEKLSYHLIGLARGKRKKLVRIFQSPRMLRLAEKIKEKPRKLYVKGKLKGRAEAIKIERVLGTAHTAIKPKLLRKPKPKKLKRKPKRPR